MLARAAHEGRIVISPLIHAGLSVRYPRIEDLDEALPWPAAFLAAKAFRILGS